MVLLEKGSLAALSLKNDLALLVLLPPLFGARITGVCHHTSLMEC